jgi:hypothetical protein
MTNKTQPRWGILAVAVLMFLVTMIITSINGSKASIYLYVWMMVGYYAYKARLTDIQMWMKYLIYLNVLVVVLVMIFMESDNLGYLKSGGKSDLLVGVLVMLVPKILLFFYCKNQLETSTDGSNSSQWEQESSSQEGEPITASPLVAKVDSKSQSVTQTNAGVPKALVPSSDANSMSGGLISPHKAVYSADASVEMRNQNAPHTNNKGSSRMGTDESIEENYWAVAMAEVESNQRRPGVWAKAFAEADGDTTKAKVAYLKVRVQQMLLLAQEEAEKLASLQRDEEAKKQLLELALKPEIEEAISSFLNYGIISETKLRLLLSQKDISKIVNTRDSIKGNTFLHVCARNDMLDEVRILLAAGASPNEPNYQGLLPYYMTNNEHIRWVLDEGFLNPDKLNLMHELGIKVENNAFCYSGYRYDKLEDAIEYARKSISPRS